MFIPEHQSRLQEELGARHRGRQPGEHGHLGLVGVERLHVGSTADAVVAAAAQEPEQGLVLGGQGLHDVPEITL